MSNKERTAVYIDGSNLYHKLKDLNIINTINFRYIDLCNKLARDREIVSCRYYVGAIRAKENDKKSKTFRQEG